MSDSLHSSNNTSIILLDQSVVAELEGIDGGGPGSLIFQILEVYSTTSPTIIKSITDSIHAKDSKMLSHHAHSLKSSSANLGFVEMAKLCHHIEKNASVVMTNAPQVTLDKLDELFRSSIDLLHRYLEQKKAA